MKKKIGVGIVGAGGMAVDMATAFAANESFSITSVCSKSMKSALRLASHYSAVATTKYSDLLLKDDVSLIYVSVPPKYHCKYFLEALTAKKHVLCEKPLCLTDQEADEMQNAARKSASITAINYPMLYTSSLTKFRSLFQSGFIGDIRKLEIKLCFPTWPRPVVSLPYDSWVNQKDEGGPLREISTHFLHAILFILEQEDIFDSVQATLNRPEPDTHSGFESAENDAVALIHLKNGLNVHLNLLTQYAGDKEEVSLTFFGTQGRLCLDNFQFLYGAKGSESMQLLDNNNCYDPNAFMSSSGVVDAFYNALQGNKGITKELVSISTGAHIQKILNSILVN